MVLTRIDRSRMADAPQVRFAVNTDKVVEALTWLANKQPGIDIFHACKTLFLADRDHLQKYGRPILGDRYVAMDDGPVPSFAYYVAQGDGLHVDGQTLEKASQAFRYDRAGRYPKLFANREANSKLFSRTDLACLSDAAKKYAGMDFNKLWDLVHADRAYNAAISSMGENADMNYELFLDPDDPDFVDQLRDLRETAPYLSF